MSILVEFIKKHKQSSIGILLALLASGVVFLSDIIDLSEKVIQKNADLLVNTLNDHTDRLTPLDGYPILKDSKGNTVYTGGVKASFTLSHNKEGSESITVRGMRVNIEKYEKENKYKFSYKIDSAKVHGQGFAEPKIFRVSLFGKDQGKAKWIIDKKVYKSQDDNMLNTNPPKYIKLDSETDDVEEVFGNIVAQDPGYYEVSVSFFYHVGGKDYEHRTGTFSVFVK